MFAKLLPIDRVAGYIEPAIFTLFTLWCTLILFAAFQPYSLSESLGADFVMAVFVFASGWYIFPIFTFRQYLKIKKQRTQAHPPNRLLDLVGWLVTLGGFGFLIVYIATNPWYQGAGRSDIPGALVPGSILAIALGVYTNLAVQGMYYVFCSPSFGRRNLWYSVPGLALLTLVATNGYWSGVDYHLSVIINSFALWLIPFSYTMYLYAGRWQIWHQNRSQTSAKSTAESPKNT